MKHDKVLDDFEKTVGKTVAAADFDQYSESWMRFTDGTVIVFNIDLVDDDTESSMYVDHDPNPHTLRALGVIDDDECAAAVRELSQRFVKAKEEKERAEFERLKAKFGTSV